MTRAGPGRRRRGGTRLAVATLAVVVAAAVLAAAPATGAATATGTVLGPGFYPRMVRLAHAGAENGTILATYQLGQDGVVVRSTDGGATFTELSRIDVGPATSLPPPGGLCCVELFEMPRDLGRFPAGTLLWAGSITERLDPRRNRLGIWRSDDHGRTWVPHGTCAEADGGLWEPELLVAADGSLVCLYSDEADERQAGPPVGQDLVLATSTDGGQTFGAPRTVATGPGPYGRPGMATTARLPDGTWAMTYELCGWLPPCQVRIKFSPDGIDWGDPAVHGDVVSTAAGATFLHTPVLAWSPAGGDMGTLVLTGQVLVDAAGNPEPGSGATILLHRGGGRGPWEAAPAPVAIPEPFDHYCPNYSSPVLPLDGDALLGMATEWTGDSCLVRYATGSLPPAPPVPTTTVPPTSTTTSTTGGSSAGDAAPRAEAPPRFTG